MGTTPTGVSLLGGVAAPVPFVPGGLAQNRSMANRAKADATIGPNIVNHNTINVQAPSTNGRKGRKQVIKSIPAKAEQNWQRVIQIKISVNYPRK